MNQKENKLAPIAQMLAQVLKNQFGEPATYCFEQKHSWLSNVPDRQMFENEAWNEISTIYRLLVDNRWTLDQRLKEHGATIKRGNQKYDVWFDAPYNFAFEFDEKQHFNQFRLITLENFSHYRSFSFDYEHYTDASRQHAVKPGTSGFRRLKSNDPLFPPLLLGEKQDNRDRQRAFRDFLKDIIPRELSGINPTMRVSYLVANGKRADFSENDIASIRDHIKDSGLLNKIQLN